jgi:hypothetical protein
MDTIRHGSTHSSSEARTIVEHFHDDDLGVSIASFVLES